MLEQVGGDFGDLAGRAHRVHRRDAYANADRADDVAFELGGRVAMRVEMLDELLDDDGVLLLDVAHQDQKDAANEARVLPARRFVAVQIGQNGRDYFVDRGEVRFVG